MNKPRLLVLGERPRNLPHHFAGRISAVGEIIAVRCKHADLAFDQREYAKLLRHEVMGEARDASSTITVRTPLPPMRSSRAEKPGHVSMGSDPDTAGS